MNFARYRAFVLGLTKVPIAGGLAPAISFCTCTAGGKQGGVAPFDERSERENVGPVCPSGRLDGVLKAAGARGHCGIVAEDRLVTSLGLREVFFNEQHGRADCGFQKNAISAQPTCVRALCAGREELRSRAGRFRQMAPAERRTLYGPRATVFEKRVEEHA